MKKKELTMTISQFMSIERGDITLNKVEKLNSIIVNIDKKSYKKAVVTIAAILLVLVKSNVVFAEGLSQIDAAGEKLLSIAQQICYWICLIMGVKEVMTELLKGDAIHNPSDIMRAIIKYTIAFASVYFMPYLFDMIKTMF